MLGSIWNIISFIFKIVLKRNPFFDNKYLKICVIENIISIGDWYASLEAH